MTKVSLRDCIAPSFYGLHKSIQRGEYSSYWLKGGRGSTKSSFAAIQIILGMVNDPNANALVLRKVDNTIRTSVYETLLWAIDTLELNQYFSSIKSPAEITYLPTGQKIIMKGLDDARKLKSIRLQRGYFKFLWFEEAEEFAGMAEIRNVRQSTRRGGEKFVEFVTYNPPNDPAAWVNADSEIEIPDRCVHFSNYLDVPRHWLGETFFQDADMLKQVDPLAYDHEYMGLAVGRAEQIVFHGKWKEKDFETPNVRDMYQSRFFFGADWGFANDPTTLTRLFIMLENGERNLYIDHEAGGVGVEMEEIPQLFDSVPDVRKWRVYADCARPETISYVKRKGFNIEAAPKWQGSVEDGVEYLRSFHNIYIHPRCQKTIEEYKKYSYKVDKNTNEILPVIVDKHNHYIDGNRYALADYIKANVSIFDVL
jgi:phage terminase large subunit